MKQRLSEVKRMKELAGLITENEDQGSLSADKQDQFWSIASDTNFEQSLQAFKDANFTVDDIIGFIQSHWDRM